MSKLFYAITLLTLIISIPAISCEKVILVEKVGATSGYDAVSHVKITKASLSVLSSAGCKITKTLMTEDQWEKLQLANLAKKKAKRKGPTAKQPAF